MDTLEDFRECRFRRQLDFLTSWTQTCFTEIWVESVFGVFEVFLWEGGSENFLGGGKVGQRQQLFLSAFPCEMQDTGVGQLKSQLRPGKCRVAVAFPDNARFAFFDAFSFVQRSFHCIFFPRVIASRAYSIIKNRTRTSSTFFSFFFLLYISFVFDEGPSCLPALAKKGISYETQTLDRLCPFLNSTTIDVPTPVLPLR